MIQVVKSMIAGYVATRMMTKCMYEIAPSMMMPRVDIAGAISSAGKESAGNSKDEFDPRPDKDDRQPGMLTHYMLGSLIFPLSYELVFRHLLPGGRVTKGVLWGTGLWAVGQSVVLPGSVRRSSLRRNPQDGLPTFLYIWYTGLSIVPVPK